MQQPLVLAIEPDLRQAAIVKRIVREKVLADVAVVDSRDAALEAMRSTMPDVLLLSALLSPRDEDELIAHLRTLQHAEHLQTHTIPQLASAIGQDEDKPRGLLSAFRRRKGAASVPAGCDPDLFAEEIRTYLQRASEKKRELRDNPSRESGPSAFAGASNAATASSAEDGAAGETAAPESAWSSPFEWRPTRGEKKTTKREERPKREAVVVPAPEPAVVAAPEFDPVPDPEPAGPEFAPVPDPEPVVAEFVPVPEPEPVVLAAPEPSSILAAEPVSLPDPEPVVVARPEPVVVRRKLPLVKRQPRDWWFEDKDTKDTKDTKELDSEMRAVLASLSVPMHVAVIGYAEGCRIRRVRLAAD